MHLIPPFHRHIYILRTHTHYHTHAHTAPSMRFIPLPVERLCRRPAFLLGLGGLASTSSSTAYSTRATTAAAATSTTTSSSPPPPPPPPTPTTATTTTTSSTTMTGKGPSSSTSSSSPDTHSWRPREHLYTPPPPHLSLKQVLIIARHGDRAPIARNIGNVIKDSEETQNLWQSKLPKIEEITAWQSTFPPSVNIQPLDQTEFPYSQLTVRGAEELRSLGTHLRKRYISQLQFLPDTLHTHTHTHTHDKEASETHKDHPHPHKLIYARATNIRRTQQSAQNLLLGLLFPSDTHTGTHTHTRTLLPIEVRPTHEETLYPNADRKCKRQEEIIAEIRNEHYHLETEEEIEWYKSLAVEAKEKLGLESFVPWNQVREVFTCHLVHQVPYPPSVDEAFVQDIIKFTGTMWGSWFRHKEFARLGIGPFLEEMLAKMEEGVTTHTHTHRLVIYSGHDSTIVPLLAALGIYNDIWPPYASNIVIELAEDTHTHTHYVRVLYNDEEQCLKLGEGEVAPVWCEWKEFASFLRPLIPHDYERECMCKEGGGGGLVEDGEGVGSTIK